MLLGVLIIFLISEAQLESSEHKQLESSEHKYTIGIDLLSLAPIVVGFGHASSFILLLPDVNFELKVGRKVSMDFGLTMLYIIPIGGRVGVREYLGKKGFRGFYLYQHLGALFFLVDTTVPYLTFGGGYKYVSKGGFTVNPFLVLGLQFDNFRIGGPGQGLYLGYTW